MRKLEPGVRRLSDTDVSMVRQLRLAALLDAPDAFASTLAREQALTHDDWLARMGGGRAWFAAGTVGLACGQPSAERIAERIDLVSMWVSRPNRGRGLAGALVGAVADWARDGGAAEVALWVVESNDAAIRAYDKAGFVETGRRQPLPSNPILSERELVLPL